jgi:hypothetical protein
VRYALIHKFCAESGYSEKAVRRKIEAGVWLEGRQWRRAPDGHIMIDRDEVSASPNGAPEGGVYLLLIAGQVVYVGRSVDLLSRLAEHRRSGRPFDETRVIPCDLERSIWLERELIRTLDPEQNRVRYERHAAEMARSLEGISP